MKKILYIFSLLNLVCLCAYADVSVAAKAGAMRDDALAKYAEFENQRRLADRNHSEKLRELRGQLLRLENELENEKALEKKLSAGAQDLIEINADFERIGIAAGALERAFGLPVRFAPNFETAAAYAVDSACRANDSFFDAVKTGVEAEVENGAGEKLRGKIFKVGAFKYFSDGNTAGFVGADFKLYGEKYSKMILNFIDGKTNVLPVDLSAGKFMRDQFGRRGILAEIRAGGIWMYPILFFGILSVGVCAVKIPSMLRIRKLDKNSLQKIFAAISQENEAAALKICENVGSPYSTMLARLVCSRKLGASALEEISYECMLEAGGRLFSGLSILSVSAAVAPLFGLLGTVTGIIKTFGDLSFHGAQQAQSISAGISEALITTEYGLIVAIPAFVAHALLSRSAKAVMADMEKAASAFLGKNS